MKQQQTHTEMTKQVKKVNAHETVVNHKGQEVIFGGSFWAVFVNGKMINDEQYKAKWVAEMCEGLNG